MKNPFIQIALALVFSLFIVKSDAQNLVPNCSFEQYNTCPSNVAQVNNCVNWRQYNGSPDYFNVCNTGSVGVPSNVFGYQAAAHGQAYVGLVAILTSGNFREYVVDTLTSPLVVGNVYEVSMSVSLANGYAQVGSNNLGVWFYRNGPSSVTGSSLLPVTPQVTYTSYGPVTDTQNWVRLTTLYSPDSAYTNLVIGGFFANTAVTTANVTSSSGYAYYYIDSVVVKLANGINNLYADSMICAGDTFQVPYTLNSTTIFTSGNIFTAQLSNSSGTFTSGVTTIGTRTGNTSGSITCVVPNTITPGNNYRIRIISSSAADSSPANQYAISVGVVKPAKPIASNNGPICTSATLNLYANSTTSGVSYKWTGPASFNSTLQNPSIASATTANSGAYIVTARLFGCISKDTTNASVSSVSASSITANANTPVCERDTLKLTGTVTQTANSYSWSGPNSFSASAKDVNLLNVQPVASGDYILTANYTGCSVKDTVTVLVKPLAANRSISSNSPVCTDNTLNLTAGSSSTGVSYSWTGPNGFNALVATPSISGVTTAAAGTYVVSYNLVGCFVKDSVVVTVNTSPIPVNATTNAPVCESDTVKLFSSNSTSGVTWNWAGPNSFNASVQNPYIVNSTLNASGDYIVTASLSNGCSKKDTVTVLVKPLPGNMSNSNNGPLCAGATLLLSGNTSSTGVTWSWVGPASFSSALQNPNISGTTTAMSGDYIATATLNGCTLKDTTTVLIKPNPAMPTAAANTPVCTGQDLKLSASTVPGVTYDWTGPVSYTSSIQNPVRVSATSAMAGTYYVRSMLNGCYSANSSVAVNVLPAPNVGVYPSPKDSICQGATLTLVSNTTNAGTSPVYRWHKNNIPIPGGTTANHITTTANDLDEYFCSITVTGICAEPFIDSSAKILIHVLPWLTPSVSITASPTGTVSSGTTITFTATPTNGGKQPKYQWKRNSANVLGAISNTWGAPTLSNSDVICVDMTSNYLCPSPATVKSNCITVSIETTGIGELNWRNNPPKVYPNPFTNQLIIEGITAGTIVQLIDVLGRTVLHKTAETANTTINTASITPGNYILQLKNESNTLTLKITKE